MFPANVRFPAAGGPFSTMQVGQVPPQPVEATGYPANPMQEAQQGMPRQPQQYPPGMPMRQPAMMAQQRFPQQPNKVPGYPSPAQQGMQTQTGFPASPMQAAQQGMTPQTAMPPLPGMATGFSASPMQPNPIQAMGENHKTAGDPFSMQQLGQVPPLVTTEFVTQDQSNSGPRQVRPPMNNGAMHPANTGAMPEQFVAKPALSPQAQQHPGPPMSNGQNQQSAAMYQQQGQFPPQPVKQTMPPLPGMPPQPGMTTQPQQYPPGAMSNGQNQQNAAMYQQQGQFPPQPVKAPGYPASPMQPAQQGMPPQTGFPASPMQASQPGMPPLPGMPPQPGMTTQHGMPPQPQQYPPGAMPNRQSFSQQGAPMYQQQQPGQFPQQPGMATGYPASPMQAAPQRRLDPDQMPNPIQVMAENQRTAGGLFSTLQVGQVPPLVTTEFVTQDQGNSGPRYVRSTMYNVPATTDMMKQSPVPFALVISPFARAVEGEMAPPVVDFGEIGPIRCVRCKAYMSPHMQFTDAGRRFQCLLCKATTEVPPEYFQHLDHTGQRVDKYERPELVLGTYEFVATKDYCRDNVPPKPPAMVFVIDVSYNNVKSGLVHLICAQMKSIIRNLPIDQGETRTKMKVGFITYNNSVHFYNIKSTLAQPQMMVVGDVHEMFMPLLDGFLADPEESEAVIDLLMEQIPKMYGDTRETETILLPAVQAGLEALKASATVGKLLIFHSSLPACDAPGQLKNRDDRKLLGTEKEKTILTPQSTAYNNLGQDCVNSGCSVDLFIFNNSYIDLATIGQVSRLTGGEIYKYTYFQSDVDGQRLVADIIKNISRPIAFDTVMRVRTSTGTRPTDFFGHFYMSNTTDMEIASIDCDKSVAIEIKHDDKLAPEENVYIQIALLYTSSGGQRRLRVMNLALKTCTQLADLFRSCDLDTTILFFAKQGVTKLLEHTPKVFKDNLVNRAAQILACYRKHCASPTSAGQLILPECLKLLPLYVSCLLKNDAFSGGSDLTVDDRSYAMYFVSTMDLPTSVTFFYPQLIPIHSVDPESSDMPSPIRCTIDKITDDGAYILDNGIYMFIYLGLGLSPEFTQSVFGAQGTQQVDTDRIGLPVFDNNWSKRVRGIVENIQKERTRCMRIALVRQRDKLEAVLRHFLIEDRGGNGSESYVDFLCFMHKEIRSLLS